MSCSPLTAMFESLRLPMLTVRPDTAAHTSAPPVQSMASGTTIETEEDNPPGKSAL